MHEKDFGMKAEWHFFSTSHVKNLCNGVKGTIKRLTACASIQRAIDNQILNPHTLYFQNFWPPDMEMPGNLEEGAKTFNLFPMVTIF